MAITHVHGMSSRAFEKWKAGAHKDDNRRSSPWTVSELDDYTYLWSVAKINEELDDLESAIMEAKQCAYQSALFQSALDNSKDYIYLFELSLTEGQYEDDTSCSGMSECDRMPEYLLNSETIIKVVRVQYNHYLAPVIIKGLLGKALFNLNNVSADLLRAARLVSEDTLSNADELLVYEEEEEYSLVYP